MHTTEEAAPLHHDVLVCGWPGAAVGTQQRGRQPRGVAVGTQQRRAGAVARAAGGVQPEGRICRHACGAWQTRERPGGCWAARSQQRGSLGTAEQRALLVGPRPLPRPSRRSPPQRLPFSTPARTNLASAAPAEALAPRALRCPAAAAHGTGRAQQRGTRHSCLMQQSPQPCCSPTVVAPRFPFER